LRTEEELIVNDEAQNNPTDGSKKPYAKPQIQEVPLRPEEAVLGACKTSSVSGPAQAKCSFPSACSSQLS
jgi:hypothetical protein